MTRLALALALAVLCTPALAGDDPRDSGPDSLDVSKYPAEQKARYPLFRDKCSKCHPLSRAIGAKLGAQEWKSYMKRMVRRPNSGINDEQAESIHEFLKYFASQQGN